LRRLLVFLCVACALAATPALASADGFSIDFGQPGLGSLRVHNFEDCPGSFCEASPVEIRLERTGAVVEAAGPALEPSIKSQPLPGDVVRVLRDGVERAAVPYDGMPSVDDTSCAVVGGTTLTGTFRHGEPGTRTFGSPGYGLLVDPYTYLRFAFWLLPEGGLSEGVVSTVGDRWSATFSRPIQADDALIVGNAYTVATPAGPAMVSSRPSVRICPQPLPFGPPPVEPPATPPTPPTQPPPTPACTADAIAADPAFETRLTRAVKRVRLRALRKGVARLAGVPSCASGNVAVEVRAGGRIVAKGATNLTGTTVTQALTRTRRAARLAGRRRTRVKVTVRIADVAGGTVIWSCRVTLR
jgi:hypothetical protein